MHTKRKPEQAEGSNQQSQEWQHGCQPVHPATSSYCYSIQESSEGGCTTVTLNSEELVRAVVAVLTEAKLLNAPGMPLQTFWRWSELWSGLWSLHLSGLSNQVAAQTGLETRPVTRAKNGSQVHTMMSALPASSQQSSSAVGPARSASTQSILNARTHTFE